MNESRFGESDLAVRSLSLKSYFINTEVIIGRAVEEKNMLFNVFKSKTTFPN